MPAADRSANTRAARASSSMLWSRLYAITGIITFSSNVLPNPLPANAIVASFPTTWAATIRAISLITGFTLPGMMLLPGWVAGMLISPIPHRGPLASHRTSFAILAQLIAIVLSWTGTPRTTASWPHGLRSGSRPRRTRSPVLAGD
jgi:hypothetical protein